MIIFKESTVNVTSENVEKVAPLTPYSAIQLHSLVSEYGVNGMIRLPFKSKEKL